MLRLPTSLRLIALAPLLFTGACAGGLRLPQGQDRGPESSDDGVVIQVENLNNIDVEVLFVGGAFTSRLGYVPSNSYERFFIDKGRFPGRGQVQMTIRTIPPGGEFTTPPVVLNEGEGLYLRVGQELRFSRLIVRR